MHVAADNHLFPAILGTPADPATGGGYLLSHATNDSYAVVNRLLKSNEAVYSSRDGFFIPWSAPAAGSPKYRRIVLRRQADVSAYDTMRRSFNRSSSGTSALTCSLAGWPGVTEKSPWKSTLSFGK